MYKANLVLAGVLLAVATTVASAQPVPQVISVGSSAVWQEAALGAYLDLAGPGALHYTIKGNCTSGYCGFVNDTQRDAAILNEGGSLAVVWNASETEVWAFLSVDSVVGDRAFLAVPRTLLGVDAETETTSAGAGLIATSLWGADQPNLPASIYSAINGHVITAAFTDIRPEDAKYAFTRVVTPYNAKTLAGFGYGTGPNTLIGTPIVSALVTSTPTSQANPVNFALPGNPDPFSGQTVPPAATIEIGAAAITFIINRTNPVGLGAPGVFTNINFTNAQNLFNGNTCDSTQIGGTNLPPSVPVTVILREPLSGTMNTTEFSVFRTSKIDPNKDNSQEKGINGSSKSTGINPLDLNCTAGGGKRERAIGTGQVVSNGVLDIQDSIGYVFFSFGNVSAIAGSPNYGYLQLQGVDPIQATYTNGELPTCTAPCPATPGSTFPNVRSGKYLAWSDLRAVTDAPGTTNYTNLDLLIRSMQDEVNFTVPDFVPAVAAAGDPGLQVYRSHYTQSGVAPNNGLSGETEAGGDMGGCIEKVGPAPGVLNCHQ
jgi:hypothetical protein